MSQEVVPANGVVAGLDFYRELERIGAASTTGLRLDSLNITYEQMESLAVMLGEIRKAMVWSLGDLIVQSELRFGELWPQIAAATGLSESTQANYASLARRIPIDRRRAALSPSTHEVVAKLPPREQDEWLDRAEREGWSRTELRAHLVEDTASETCPTCGQIVRGER